MKTCIKVGLHNEYMIFLCTRGLGQSLIFDQVHSYFNINKLNGTKLYMKPPGVRELKIYTSSGHMTMCV